ncbi:hypothetical protein BCV69DRAFT_47776 [Microstroma glucosiphilum]|uniref:Uncharacterized protein n=1 Tax=Pseudomicrostroma glucosiphilum TaxID=1684307 RepID=A0A316U4C3_9BASI|nr:hypothetical protein BCV69DRAFT_47776 [Pseudomicrostroma glucosiphilum]PWN19213.1 hypothetical protein BCV69DRAFT_47776 [Pseudomicrostroma glucosiphilum]
MREERRQHYLEEYQGGLRVLLDVDECCEGFVDLRQVSFGDCPFDRCFLVLRPMRFGSFLACVTYVLLTRSEPTDDVSRSSLCTTCKTCFRFHATAVPPWRSHLHTWGKGSDISNPVWPLRVIRRGLKLRGFREYRGHPSALAQSSGMSQHVETG